MIILNTTFIVADNLTDSFTEWARKVYIPAMESSGVFASAPCMARVLTQVEPGATSIALQARAESLEEATRWHDDTAALLRDDLLVRFNRQVLFFTTYMEILSNWSNLF